MPRINPSIPPSGLTSGSIPETQHRLTAPTATDEASKAAIERERAGGVQTQYALHGNAGFAGGLPGRDRYGDGASGAALAACRT
jgi:hypothetical protein